MGPSRALGLAALVAACGAPTVPAAPAPGPAPWHDERAPVPDDVQQGLRDVADVARTTLAACREQVVAKIDEAKVAAEGFPFDRATLDASPCGAAGRLYDERAPALLGRSQTGDVLLGDLARVGDDLDYLRRTMVDDPRPDERVNAVRHVAGALKDGEDRVARMAGEPIWAHGGFGFGTADGWRRVVTSDGPDLQRLRDFLERYAFVQGLDPAMVRGRMLSACFTPAREARAIRSRELAAAAVDPAEAAARAAYDAVVDDTFRHLDAIATVYVEGRVRTEAERQARLAEAATAMAAFAPAWAAERARIGVTP